MIRCVTENPDSLRRLQVAFRACQQDFEELKAEVRAGRVSLYELSGDNYRLTIAGEIIGESYFLWGVAGRGVVPAIRELAEVVKRAGLTSLSAETYFPGIPRLLKRLNITDTALTHTTHMTMRV